MSTTFLVADVGGTNMRVGLAHDGDFDASSVQRFENDANDGIADVLAIYLSNRPEITIDAVCVDIAGPVADGTGQLTNRPWKITQHQLKEVTGAQHADVLNDMQAQGFGLSSLTNRITGAPYNAHATGMVVNIGTGFNSAVVLGTDQDTLVPGSETGHMSLPIQSAKHFELAKFIEHIEGFAAVEDVLSGRGIVTVYQWHSTCQGHTSTKRSHQIFADVTTDPLAHATVATFVEMLGHVCGNLALTHLPFGGIYLVGGMARAIAPFMADFGFEDAFYDKGRFSNFLKDFAVNVVEDDDTALFGCTAHLKHITAHNG